MADKPSHINQWKHNRRFMESIDPQFHDWIVTAAFYTALHAIDSLLAHDRVVVTNHEGRNRALHLTNRYEFINQKYHPLYGLARTMRYFANPLKWVPAATIKSQVIERYLYPIEKSVQKLMGEDLALLPVRLKV
jgi:hypothetical protein